MRYMFGILECLNLFTIQPSYVAKMGNVGNNQGMTYFIGGVHPTSKPQAPPRAHGLIISSINLSKICLVPTRGCPDVSGEECKH